MKKWIITYTVTGFGQFPIDMLRHDRSFPASEMESGKIAQTFHKGGDRWSISLAMHGATRADGPCEGRWQSFCCKVSDVEARKLS